MARGRPAREPTAQERDRVKEFVAEGASQRVISVAVGRSVPNLRKFFAVELGCEKKSGPEEPPFKITAGMCADVALMAACNEPRDRIARAIGVSETDLAKFFAEDMEAGAARFRLKTLRQLDKLSDAGNLGAAKQLAAMTAPSAADETAPSGYVGKKAAAKADADAAVSAGGKFAPRSPPRLAAVNGRSLRAAH